MKIHTGKIDAPQKVVVYGPEGIGKSTFASLFPDPLFIDTEASTTHMDVKRFDRPRSWAMLMDQILYAINEKGICNTLVIDTADWAEKLCAQHVMQQNRWSSIETPGYGKGYVALAEEFGRMLNLLQQAINQGLNVVITAHAMMRKFEQPDEDGSYDRWELKLEKKTAPLLKEWADALLFVNFKTYVTDKDKNGRGKGKGQSRKMYATHNAAWDAKNRWGLPDVNEFEYSIIAHHIFGEAKEAQKSPKPDPQPQPQPEPAQAPPVQVQSNIDPRLKQLMDTDGVTLDELMHSVYARGHFPLGTKYEALPQDFIEGALIAYWPQVRTLIEELRTQKQIEI